MSLKHQASSNDGRRQALRQDHQATDQWTFWIFQAHIWKSFLSAMNRFPAAALNVPCAARATARFGFSGLVSMEEKVHFHGVIWLLIRHNWNVGKTQRWERRTIIAPGPQAGSMAFRKAAIACD
jgi:hypothetical protein